jgi:ssDNA-binding Zn-finger/Zn-ribbon topoisomerase 1
MRERKRHADGHAFLGCARYPECRGTRDINDPDDHYEQDSMFADDFGIFHD